MKYLKFLLLIPLAFMLTGSVTNQMLQVVARKNVAAGGYTYLIEEDFEAGSLPSGWFTGTPAVNWTAAGLEGTYAVQVDPSAETMQALSPETTETDDTTTCFMFKYATGVIYQGFVHGLDATQAQRPWFVGWGSATNKLFLSHGTTQTGDSTITLSTGTTYYVWVEFETGTGANGILNLFISTTTTKPGAADLSISNGNSTYSHARTRLGTGSSLTFDITFDHLRVVDGGAGTVTDWPE